MSNGDERMKADLIRKIQRYGTGSINKVLHTEHKNLRECVTALNEMNLDKLNELFDRLWQLELDSKGQK